MPIGPRFSNSVLQTLLVLLKKTPSKGKRLLIIATTTQKHVLEQMDMSDGFNAEIYIPTITDLSSVEVVLQELKLFSEVERRKAMDMLLRSGVGNKLSVGIKKLMMNIEMARQDEDQVEKFISCLTEDGGLSAMRI